jgi:hypothetical protein
MYLNMDQPAEDFFSSSPPSSPGDSDDSMESLRVHEDFGEVIRQQEEAKLLMKTLASIAAAGSDDPFLDLESAAEEGGEKVECDTFFVPFSPSPTFHCSS